MQLDSHFLSAWHGLPAAFTFRDQRNARQASVFLSLRVSGPTEVSQQERQHRVAIAYQGDGHKMLGSASWSERRFELCRAVNLNCYVNVFFGCDRYRYQKYSYKDGNPHMLGQAQDINGRLPMIFDLFKKKVNGDVLQAYLQVSN